MTRVVRKYVGLSTIGRRMSGDINCAVFIQKNEMVGMNENKLEHRSKKVAEAMRNLRETAKRVGFKASLSELLEAIDE